MAFTGRRKKESLRMCLTFGVESKRNLEGAEPELETSSSFWAKDKKSS